MKSIILTALLLCSITVSAQYQKKVKQYENYVSMGILVSGFAVNETISMNPNFASMTHHEQYKVRGTVFLTAAATSALFNFGVKAYRNNKRDKTNSELIFKRVFTYNNRSWKQRI